MIKKKIVLTYGTYDLFHIGHLNLLERLKELGDYLIVGVSTDEFNAQKNKKTIIPFEDRIKIVQAMKCVDLAIAEENWDQKRSDILKYDVDIFGMGHDWTGKFDDLSDMCEVIYLPRTEGISSTQIKTSLKVLDQNNILQMKEALDVMLSIVQKLD